MAAQRLLRECLQFKKIKDDPLKKTLNDLLDKADEKKLNTCWLRWKQTSTLLRLTKFRKSWSYNTPCTTSTTSWLSLTKKQIWHHHLQHRRRLKKKRLLQEHLTRHLKKTTCLSHGIRSQQKWWHVVLLVVDVQMSHKSAWTSKTASNATMKHATPNMQ